MLKRTCLVAAAAACLAESFAPAPACAEHRVALIIQIDKYEDAELKASTANVQRIEAALTRRGFRCTTVRNVQENDFRDVFDRFANTTPTRGAALVFFSGEARSGSYKGKRGVTLLGANSRPERGYVLSEAMEKLSTRGGSRYNLFVLDTPQQPSHKFDLPAGCQVAYLNSDGFAQQLSGDGDLVAAIDAAGSGVRSTLPAGAQVVGAGSVAISPPDRFVPGKKAGDEWVNARGAVFCWCPPGRYVKGSPAGEPGRYPDEAQQEVVIRDGFWISKYELTISENPRGNKPRNAIGSGKNHPLTMVNHDDARRMTRRTLTEAERKAGRLPADWEYSLTTEQQWEYACRAGTDTAWHFGNDPRLLPEYANFADKSFFDTGGIYTNYGHRTLDDGYEQLSPVGSFKPNGWGIHDMHGNVAEWCWSQMTRGGSWVSTPAACRSAHRHLFTSRNEQNFIGYRLVIQKAVPEKGK